MSTGRVTATLQGHQLPARSEAFSPDGGTLAVAGEDYSVSHVPSQARAVLKRFDERAAHYEVIDRRPQ